MGLDSVNNSDSGKIVIFTDSFPYGAGETFFEGELPFIAKEFEQVVIFPLQNPAMSTKAKNSKSNVRKTPANVLVSEPLLPFCDKDKKSLLRHGLFNRKRLINLSPLFFACGEFFRRTLLGKEIHVAFRKKTLLPAAQNKLARKCAENNAESNKKAPLGKRIWIFFNYLLLLRSVMGNAGVMQKIKEECSAAQVVYFYWSDKSAMLAPFLKKVVHTDFIARFHGSDFYEGAKGYLPFRKQIIAALDAGFPVSEGGLEYLHANYKILPKRLEVSYLGSFNDAGMKNPGKEEADNAICNAPRLKIVSCSNMIELKRVDLLLDAIELLYKDKGLCNNILQRGYNGMEWVHFGGGLLYEPLKKRADELMGRNLTLSIEFKGHTPHEDILKYYSHNHLDIMILLSRSEGIPVSLMEALSFGIPIMATNVGDVRELFNECPIGYLLEANPSAKIVKEKLAEFALLPQAIQNQMRSNAFSNWAEHWNARKNYRTFAANLTKL